MQFGADDMPPGLYGALPVGVHAHAAAAMPPRAMSADAVVGTPPQPRLRQGSRRRVRSAHDAHGAHPSPPPPPPGAAAAAGGDHAAADGALAGGFALEPAPGVGVQGAAANQQQLMYQMQMHQMRQVRVEADSQTLKPSVNLNPLSLVSLP